MDWDICRAGDLQERDPRTVRAQCWLHQLLHYQGSRREGLLAWLSSPHVCQQRGRPRARYKLRMSPAQDSSCTSLALLLPLHTGHGRTPSPPGHGDQLPLPLNPLATCKELEWQVDVSHTQCNPAFPKHMPVKVSWHIFFGYLNNVEISCKNCKYVFNLAIPSQGINSARSLI